MKSDYHFLVTKNHNKLVNVTGWHTRVCLPTGLFIAKPERKNMIFLTVVRIGSMMIHSLLGEGKIRRTSQTARKER